MNETTNPRHATKRPGTLNMTQAARAFGVARSTVSRDIQRGKLSGTRDAQGRVWLEVMELERVYGKKIAHSETPPQATVAEPNEPQEVAALREQLKALREEKDAQQSALQQEITTLRAQIASLRQILTTTKDQATLTVEREQRPPPAALTSDEADHLPRSGVFRAVLLGFLAVLLAVLMGFLLVLFL
jgi:transposase-like protein